MARRKLRRIGVLTGGGDCPGLNAVIRAVTKSAIFEHGLEVVGVLDGFLGLIQDRMRRLGPADVSNILTQGGTILGTSNKADPKRYEVGRRDGHPVYADVKDRVVRHARRRGLDLLVCIGGDGTMSGAADLIRAGIPCLGVPKTIDNDLAETELTFGFQTAVDIATEALDRVHTTASSHHRVMLVECMGRNAGWLTLHAGVASGADVILIPEIPYALPRVAEACLRRSRRGKSFTIIAVSEGARPAGGDVVVRQMVEGSTDPVRLGGISQVLAREIADATGIETRATILGHVQRGGTPDAQDRVLSTLFGHAALRLAAQGRWNRLVVWRGGRLDSVPIRAVAHRQRLVPLDHPLLAAARAVGTSFGD